MPHELMTERLVLRELTVADAPALRQICTQPYVLKWMPDWEMPLADMEGLIAWYCDCYAKPETMRIMLAMTLKDSGKMIGLVGTGRKPEVDDDVEIMYYIDEAFSARGYTSEAARALADHALQTLAIDHLIGIAEPDNPGSQKVLARAGFTQEGTRLILNSGEHEEKPFLYYRRNR
ncbi:MAG: GNAT family N-acetyltransferase [Uliginosibacterium sp.]|nr:GNAT family N-acetyltransferase [Uliginosibacterium sp.]